MRSARIGGAFGVLVVLVGLLPDPPARAGAYDGQVVEEAVIPTRYHENLRIQLAFPATGGVKADGQFPVIVDYTPYCGSTPDQSWITAGYVGARVQMPGNCGSEGRMEIFTDRVGWSGFDAIEWLGTQPWSTGKVGMFGCSADAIAQFWTAQHEPPHLTTIVPSCPAYDLYSQGLYRGGMLQYTDWAAYSAILFGAFWGEGLAQRAQSPDELQATIDNRWVLPDLLPLVALFHPNKDDFWRTYVADVTKIGVPMWVWGNWDDLFLRGTVGAYLNAPSSYHAMAMGYAGHADPGPGFNAIGEELRWFDRWLKGIDNGIDREPRFRYYTKQEFVWHAADDFPVPGTNFVAYHLGSGQPIAGATGILSTTASDPSVSDSYVYAGAQGLHDGQQGFVPLNQVKPNTPANDNLVGYNDPLGSGDQRLDAPDALTYIGEPLSNDTEVTGPVTMNLVAASSATDTDWLINLIDVFPDGAPSATGPQPGYWNLADLGQLKGTHRDGDWTQEPIPPGVPVTYKIDMQPTSYLFRAGHRIGLQIESAEALRSQPNPNPAVNTVFHSSTIVLPIIPR